MLWEYSTPMLWACLKAESYEIDQFVINIIIGWYKETKGKAYIQSVMFY